MLKNLFTVALRNFKRDKWYSLLNILGLTIGITFSLFLIFYIRDELSYDRYNERADRIVRIGSHIKEADKPMMNWVSTQFVLAAQLKKDYPEVQESLHFIDNGVTMFKHGELHFYEHNVYYTDSNVFRVFTYPLLQGDPRTALVAPHSVVLCESIARAFFGNSADIVGQSLQDGTGGIYKITGVMKDVPANSHFRPRILLSATTLPAGADNSWGSFNHMTYVLLAPHTDASALEKKLLPMYDKYMAVIFKKFNVDIRYAVTPITTIHLHSEFQGEPEDLGSMSYIYIFSAVAFFMLAIACINYMNLTTARSARRAKEIGIRKVTGSTQSQLIAQFLIESTATALFALVLSMLLVWLLLPTFNILSGKSITFGTLLAPSTFLILLAIVGFVGLLGGSYPALYLSKFDPIHILKGNLSKGSSNVVLRRILVVTQFSIAMIMLICTLVVYGQLKYLRKIDLGFNQDQVAAIAVHADRDTRSQILAFKSEVRKDPHILAASSASASPGDGVGFNLWSIPTSKGYVEKGVSVFAIDEDYIPTLGIQLKKGRNFSGPADTLNSVLVNQNLVTTYGWKEPIGQRLKRPGDTSGRYLEVVGVVKDFNQKSLYNPIEPIILLYRPNRDNIQVKLDAKDIPGGIVAMQKAWKDNFPDLPFEYLFLDQKFNSQYAADQRRGQLFTTFSVLTILITCLGLLGLIAFTTQQRQKEISMRKIMGAGIGQIITLITRNFVALVGVSCLIAFPVAGLFMDKWLKIFPYNTGLSPTPFVLAALTVLVITLLTVIYHTMRAALANPSKSLRME